MRAFAILMLLAFALAGCTGSDDPTTSTTTAPVGGNGSSSNATAEPSEYSCSAVAGATGSFTANLGGNEVGGCSFTTTTKATTIQAADLPDGCALYQTPPSTSNVSTEAQPAEVGQTYPEGTSYSMFCDATAVQPEGSLTLVAA